MSLLISDADIKQLPMSIKAAIPIMEETFRLAGEGSAQNVPRYRIPFENGFLHAQPAALHSRRVAGMKLLANFGSDTSMRKNLATDALNFLYDMDTGEMIAIVHCHKIGAFRTAAVSAVAAKYLSPENASSVGLYGSGRIAEGQLEAVCAVRPIKTARVYSRDPEKRMAFCKRVSERLGIKMIPAESPEEVPREADIVITATTSETPVLRGEWLVRPGLMIAAGAKHWYTRELDGEVIRKSQLVVVDDKAQSQAGCGALLWAIGHGLTTWDRVKEFGEVVVGRLPIPDFKSSVITFCSHGLGITDVAIASKAYELAKAAGLGTTIKL